MKIEYNSNNILSVCMVGSDLTSNGGIASVVRAYHFANLRRDEPLNITLIKTSYYKDKPKIFEVYIFFISIIKCLYVLSIQGVDIIHIHTSFGFSFLRKSIFVLLGKIFRKRVILHIHSSKFYEFFLSSNFFLSEYCSLIFKYSDLILVLCNDWKKKLEQKYNLRNVRLLYNPIEIGNFHPRKSEKKNELLILFLGFLIESKGIKDIISLAKKFEINGNAGIKIAIAGKGDLECFLIKAISEKYLSKIIDFKGWVTGNDKDQLLSSGDIFFLPSYKEGMPISVLEAMAYSMPIVATEIAGIPDMVQQGRNGYLFQPGDIDGYYRCFLELQKNKERIFKMGLESRKIVKFFDADMIFNKLVHIYQSIKKI